jgi:hypothetical protein
MMKYGIIISLILILTSTAIAETTNEYALIPEVRHRDGTADKYVASTTSIEATPSWDGIGEPPLSLSSAVTLATGFLSKKYTDRKDFQPNSIMLQRLWASKGNKYYWYYTLILSPKTILFKNPSQDDNDYVVVLMDGTVVEPQPLNK